MIDFRSDTVTKPTEEMKNAMFDAHVGDDVFQEDETINLLERKAADLFNHEAALFCPSGTMTNQIGIRVHTQPGGEVICSDIAHIYRYEGGGIARNSHCSVRLLNGDRGRFTAQQVAENINDSEDIHAARTQLVALENTTNKGGGAIWNINEIKAIRKVCTENNLPLHMDGARIFNALTKTDTAPAEIGQLVDSISICLSKGLGCPVGSLLIGNLEFIKEARRVRKAMGGGMRQAGFLAAAGIYALDHHVNRLQQDFVHAQQLENALRESSIVTEVLPVETNIVIFNVNKNPAEVLQYLKERGILAVQMGLNTLRFVTHLDITAQQIDKAVEILRNMK